jgi:NAD(P)-dependent dehydrogenase (short-subunit alcohol dehydrogenase family)
MHIDLTGQVALVTGAARRVGRAIARELARAGAAVLVHYHTTSPDEALDELRGFGVEAYAVQADLAQPKGVAALFAGLRAHFSRLDILVNSASNFQRRRLMDVTLDDWRETLDINLTAPLLCTQAAARIMQAQTPRGGAIINICDKGALSPWPDFAHHGISKAGLLALTKVTAASLGPDIRANAIIPGLVMKPDAMPDDRWEALAERVPLQRPGSAEDVGRAVVYLASERYLNGVVLHVDGGENLI